MGVAAGPEVAVVDGEVVIRGANVTCGYLDNPNANDAAFRDGWFQTGDEGWLDDDGYLTITGRRSEVINRGGEKIAPREVDEVLMDHPAVAHAVAFAMPHRTLGEDVVAAVTLHDSADLAPAALRAFAAERLSPAKVPRRVLVVDTLPKGPSGKLSRRVLAESLLPGRESSRAPGTAVEAALHGIFVMLLGGQEIGVDDDFFLMGGDSLRALELLDIVSDVLGVEISTEELLAGQASVAALAVAVERGRQDRPRRRLLRFQSGNGRAPVVVVDPSLLLMRHLLPQLGTNRAVVGLPMAPHENDAHRSIETLAAAHLAMVQAELPSGPYVFCGHSFAGLVAFEMAQQSTRSGHEVVLIALFDTPRPGLAVAYRPASGPRPSPPGPPPRVAARRPVSPRDQRRPGRPARERAAFRLRPRAHIGGVSPSSLPRANGTAGHRRQRGRRARPVARLG